MEKDIIKDDLIDPKKLHVVLLVLFGALNLWMLWAGFQQYKNINDFLNEKALETQHSNTSLEVGDILLTQINVPSNDASKSSKNKLYASVKTLNQQTPDAQKKTISAHHRIDKRPVYGLAGTPSFIVRPADFSFWRSQLYLETLVNLGGLLLLGLIYILVYTFSNRGENLFIAPIKNTVLPAGFLLIAGALVKWGLSFRLIHFLNSHFYIHSLDAHYPSYLVYVATPVIILGIWLEQAVRLQKEQDLTI